MSEYLLSTSGLTKQFGHHKAVNNVDLHVKKGAIYGFIGRNGAGKTTFLKMISGLSKPTDGEIQMFGYRNEELKNVRSRISCLIEAPGIYGNMSAYHNLAIKCRLFGINDSKYIENILKIVGLSEVGKKKTKHFSLGMKQRLGIGLALVGEPDLLVLDEPINGLDADGMRIMREILVDLTQNHGCTVLISSHILGELEKIATHYGIIRGGRMIKEMTAEELDAGCRTYVALKAGNMERTRNLLDRRYSCTEEDENGCLRVYDAEDPEEIVVYLYKNGILVSEIKTEKIGLEEYYIDLMGEKEGR